MGTQLRDGNIGQMGAVQVTLDPASVASNTTATQTFTVLGLRVGDFVIVQKATNTTGITISNPMVSAGNTLRITLGNHTAGAVDPPSEVYRILWFRPDVADPLVLPGAVQV